MTKLDQFESAFKSAVKEKFSRQDVQINRVVVVTDLDEAQTKRLSERVRSYLRVLGDAVEWHEVAGDGYDTVQSLLKLLESKHPDLVVTHRNLHEGQTRSAFGLGIHLDALTQATPLPVLVLPDPDREDEAEHALKDTNTVMVVADHLTGDNRLVSFGARLTERGGTLYLAHIEDDAVFDRYMAAIEKIVAIDTEEARTEIARVLLKEPTDFIENCREKLSDAGLTVERMLQMGHRLHDYQRLVEERQVDLLIFNTKDDTQLAMHGLAYPLAVELREIPLLML
ncbi:hypothetical protein ACFL59_02160 [Planctomycetota bacterium]